MEYDTHTADRLGETARMVGFFIGFSVRRCCPVCPGKIHSIESMGLVDGPGIRTVVFLQGCLLRCRYCHNPDTWALESDAAELLQPDALVRRLMRYRPYFGSTGGVTFSGGEPLLQPEFLLQALTLCREADIHTCLDTAGCGRGRYREILAQTDLVLFDVKHYTDEGYRTVTGRSREEADRFLAEAQAMGKPLWIRHVVVPGLTDGEEHLAGLEAYLRTLRGVQRVELLPYHVLGVPKYRTMGIPYPLKGVPPLDPSVLTEWNDRLNQNCCSCV